MKKVIKKRSLEERKLFFMRNLYKINYLKKVEVSKQKESLKVESVKKKK